MTGIEPAYSAWENLLGPNFVHEHAPNVAGATATPASGSSDCPCACSIAAHCGDVASAEVSEGAAVTAPANNATPVSSCALPTSWRMTDSTPRCHCPAVRNADRPRNNGSRRQQRPPAPVLRGDQHRYQNRDVCPEQGRQCDHGGRGHVHPRPGESATRYHRSGDDQGDTKQPQDVLDGTSGAQSGDEPGERLVPAELMRAQGFEPRTR